MFVLEEEQRKETDIFLKNFFFASPHLEQMKIVQNYERLSKVTLSCLCAVLLHPVYSLFLLFLLWSLETGFNRTVSWNARYCIWRWENSVSPQQPLWITTNRYNVPRQHWLEGGREREKSDEPNVSVSFRWLRMKVFLGLPTQVEYKHYLKSNYSYYKSIVSMQVEMVLKGKLLRLWYRPQRYFKRLVLKSLLITVKYVDCSKPTCN